MDKGENISSGEGNAIYRQWLENVALKYGYLNQDLSIGKDKLGECKVPVARTNAA